MIKLPSYLTGFRSRADKSIGLTFETQELSADALLELQSLNQSYGWLIYKENSIDDSDIPEDNAPKDEGEKSPTQILYGRMFMYWKEKKITGDFNTWRRAQLEVIGQRYLEKLA